MMERESVSLQGEFRVAEKSYGTDHLDLVLTNGYIAKLLGNARVVRYRAQHQQDILRNFRNSPRRKQWPLSRAPAGEDRRFFDGDGPDKRGDRRRSRTVGRIKRGDGNDGEPVRSPLG
jgi:hypothetical protein